MGDIGSLGISFWVLGLLGLLIIKTQELKYLLFLTVYGVEVVLTILERLILKENIFEAHRRHLYQLFANEKKKSHLIISSGYAGLQLTINYVIIVVNLPEWLIFAIVILLVASIYLIIKIYIKSFLDLK